MKSRRRPLEFADSFLSRLEDVPLGDPILNSTGVITGYRGLGSLRMTKYQDGHQNQVSGRFCMVLGTQNSVDQDHSLVMGQRHLLILDRGNQGSCFSAGGNDNVISVGLSSAIGHNLRVNIDAPNGWKPKIGMGLWNKDVWDTILLVGNGSSFYEKIGIKPTLEDAIENNSKTYLDNSGVLFLLKDNVYSKISQSTTLEEFNSYDVYKYKVTRQNALEVYYNGGVSIGTRNESFSLGKSTLLVGDVNSATGSFSIVSGKSNTSSSESSATFGSNNTNRLPSSLVAGEKNESVSSGAKGVSFLGVGLYGGRQDGQTWVGKYNSDQGDVIFGVGVGSSKSERRNAFLVRYSDTVKRIDLDLDTNVSGTLTGKSNFNAFEVADQELTEKLNCFMTLNDILYALDKVGAI